jgi:hypothetical protein
MGGGSWFDKLTMSGDAQALQIARPEPVLSAAEGRVEGWAANRLTIIVQLALDL